MFADRRLKFSHLHLKDGKRHHREFARDLATEFVHSNRFDLGYNGHSRYNNHETARAQMLSFKIPFIVVK